MTCHLCGTFKRIRVIDIFDVYMMAMIFLRYFAKVLSKITTIIKHFSDKDYYFSCVAAVFIII